MTTEVVKQERMNLEPVPVAENSGSAVLAIIARAASDPNVNVDKMQQLLEMQERIMARQAEADFNAAMNRLQPRLPRITKKGRIEYEKNGNKTSTPFAKYEDVDAAIKPLLCEEGFSIGFGTAPLEKGGILITATLAHRGGHSKTESMPLPFDTSGAKNAIQAVGSTLSYGKRYLVCAMLNIITENEDNDANGTTFVDQKQRETIEDLIHQCSLNAEGKAKFLEFIGAPSIAEISRGAYAAAVNFLRARARKGAQ